MTANCCASGLVVRNSPPQAVDRELRRPRSRLETSCTALQVGSSAGKPRLRRERFLDVPGDASPFLKVRPTPAVALNLIREQLWVRCKRIGRKRTHINSRKTVWRMPRVWPYSYAGLKDEKASDAVF